ncbi:Fur family ferric uptake transcriptional regulator [Peptoniphilus olsenii]|uniref:Fur family ferric uptake transcriptional regulator n=1 Tax=Peptoniphilus olsenii TaxID=411570 RepID=A0ABV2J7C5_9FIRM
MDSRTNQVRKILKENGYKYTDQRAKVYEIFLNNRDSHLTTEDIYKLISEIDPSMGIATVYRTVQLFTKLGILDQIIFDDNIVRYELRIHEQGHRHHHLICIECGKVSEVDVDELEQIEAKIEKNEKFKIIDHTLKFMGYCEDCYQKIEEKGIDEKHK